MNLAILGASGNVGRQVVRHILSDESGAVQRVVLINRRDLQDTVFTNRDARLTQHVVDMSSPDSLERMCEPLLHDVDVVVSTMGVGSGKGAAELFRRVEVELPSAFARASKRAGVRRAVILTGIGADIHSKSSWIVGGAAGGKFFYFKGLVEKNFADVGFSGGVAIFRPAGLLGTDHLPAFIDRLLPKLDWMAPARFRSIHIQQLGRAMARVAIHGPETTGPTVFDGEKLFSLFRGQRWQGDSRSLA